ncbi:MAG: hypothetical protein ACKVGW_10230 [Verrucomicrobiia bacterium]
MDANAVERFVFDQRFVESLQSRKAYRVLAYGYQAYIERTEARIPNGRVYLVAFIGCGFYAAFFFEVDVGSRQTASRLKPIRVAASRMDGR